MQINVVKVQINQDLVNQVEVNAMVKLKWIQKNMQMQAKKTCYCMKMYPMGHMQY